ncbi:MULTISPECIES: hypothetical protein [unclassified Kaistella]|uniref:hypothetical protein n=1 Tax=unclassified Kaistella TaxID=2762626 RepID=UPI002733972E|nr:MULTISPECIES: hypothetical protein [unclassified Kaistella]MDP2455221.1 hypothetical protein [Kaistella sp. SH11-4b]MDP2458068.1 hypothetical protein [Kaistella sp. SH40-3]MDP2461035.1 hypothetical protein [Kaistella sp. SH19-2b]
MENLSLLIVSLMLFIIAYQVVFVLTLDKKRKGLNDYEKLLNLRDWYQKIADEACSSYIIDSVEKRGHEVIAQFNALNANLIEIQNQHRNLQEQQKKLHSSLLEEQKLLSEYFENYS